MNTESQTFEQEEEARYLADLDAAQDLLPEHRRKNPGAAPAPTPAPAATPTEAALDPDAGDSPAPSPAPVAAPAPAAAPSEPVAELFPGFNSLPPETQAQVRGVYEARAAAERLAEQRDREYKQLHGKTAPLQSQQSKLLVEHTKLQKELSELRKATGQTNTSKFKQKLAEYAKAFPEEAQLIEEGTSAAMSEAQAAREYAAKLEQRLTQIDARLQMNQEIQQVSQAHPDWTKLRTAFDMPSGQFVPKVDTPEARDLCLWANSLDPQEREIIHPRLYSNKANDVIYALNRFKRDMQWAEAVRASASPAAPQASPAPAPAATRAPLPEVDPDVTRRASPPASSPTRNDASTEEQEYASAVELWKQRQREKQRRS